MNRIVVVNASLLLGGLLVGAGVGHFWTKKTISKYYEDLIKNELAQIKAEYSEVKHRETYVSPAEAVEARIGPDAVVMDPDELTALLDDPRLVKARDGRWLVNQEMPLSNGPISAGRDAIIAKSKYAIPAEQLQEGVTVPDSELWTGPIQQNIFINGRPLDADDHLDDYDQGIDSGNPYVMSVMLYNEHDPNFQKITLIYYTEDDVVVDDDDSVLNDVDSIIGNKNLQMFGHGSNDPEVVYVRNEKLSTDMEIIRREGSYQELVLGIHPQPKPTPRKMRESDDE
jgi:hypothetical protein